MSPRSVVDPTVAIPQAETYITLCVVPRLVANLLICKHSLSTHFSKDLNGFNSNLRPSSRGTCAWKCVLYLVSILYLTLVTFNFSHFHFIMNSIRYWFTGFFCIYSGYKYSNRWINSLDYSNFSLITKNLVSGHAACKVVERYAWATAETHCLSNATS